MKNLPGLKIGVFLALVLAVCCGVYAMKDDKPEQSMGLPVLIVKLGFEGDTTIAPADIKYDRVLSLIHLFTRDTRRYKIQEYLGPNGTPGRHEGSLNVCHEPEPTPTPSPAPSGTSAPRTTPTPVSGPTAGSSPKGAKTQTTAALALGTTHEAEEFLKLLEAKKKHH